MSYGWPVKGAMASLATNPIASTAINLRSIFRPEQLLQQNRCCDWSYEEEDYVVYEEILAVGRVYIADERGSLRIVSESNRIQLEV